MKVTAIIAGLLLCVSSASAQQGRGGGRQIAPPAASAPHRQALEKEFRQRSEQVVREKLNLSGGQLARLRSVNADIGARRNALVVQERSVRSDLREEMAKGSGADQSRVAQLLNQAHELQGKRFALQQEEQRQLSGFMTPVQVAQYVGFQAQIRQRMREMQREQNADQIPSPQEQP